jgi:nucleotide-binding universal stress UspA family protein
MPIKTILAVLNSPDTADGVIETGVALSQKYGAHLIAVYAEAPEQVFVYAPMEIPDPGAIMALQQAADERAKAIETKFTAIVEREGISHEWRKFRGLGGYSSSGVIDSARSVDMVLCAQFDENTPSAQRADIEDLIFECGRPVVVVPYITTSAKPIERIVIAWNGSREAARAAFDAMPFLLDAKEIEVVSVDAKSSQSQTADFAGSELGVTLARHGIKVTVNNVESGGKPVGAVIENRASDFAADMLVMGAYTHSRIRERIFGGATSTLLGSMTTLTLMSR